MRVIGVTGWSGSGKTTLLLKVIPILRARGLSVSTLKHAHHTFEIDKPGKDSYEHRQAGATEVLVASRRRFALMRELRDEPEWTLDALLKKMSPVDLIIVEGFKREAHAKLEVWRAATGQPPICGEDRHIVAVATDDVLPISTLPVIALNDPVAVANCLMREALPFGETIARLHAAASGPLAVD
ncbi:MAG: molybdopterin-guanine dinucleotide biosynthesis protein B [Beijerinckiaceae bacterium]